MPSLDELDKRVAALEATLRDTIIDRDYWMARFHDTLEKPWNKCSKCGIEWHGVCSVTSPCCQKDMKEHWERRERLKARLREAARRFDEKTKELL